MAKWKCEICGNEFDNFHAQGFDNKIHCPLCFFKRKTTNLEQVLNEIKELVNNGQEMSIYELASDILQIIDKHIGD